MLFSLFFNQGKVHRKFDENRSRPNEIQLLIPQFFPPPLFLIFIVESITEVSFSPHSSLIQLLLLNFATPNLSLKGHLPQETFPDFPLPPPIIKNWPLLPHVLTTCDILAPPHGKLHVLLTRYPCKNSSRVQRTQQSPASLLHTEASAWSSS